MLLQFALHQQPKHIVRRLQSLWSIPCNLMAAKIILCLSVVFSLVASIICPAYTCDALDFNICASEVSDGSIKINEKGCETGYYCSGSLVRMWSQNMYSSQNTTMFCEEGSFFSLMNSSYSYLLYTFPCDTADPNKQFRNGGLVKSCSLDDDCEYVDGTFGICVCTFKSDNTGVCFSSAENEDWLGADFARDCGTNNIITDRNTALYWNIYAVAWLFNLGSLSCVDVFGEFKDIDKFKDQITTGASYDSPNLSSAAMAMMLGFLGFLALH